MLVCSCQWERDLWERDGAAPAVLRLRGDCGGGRLFQEDGRGVARGGTQHQVMTHQGPSQCVSLELVTA